MENYPGYVRKDEGSNGESGSDGWEATKITAIGSRSLIVKCNFYVIFVKCDEALELINLESFSCSD